ncbi:MAG: phospholipase D family protein [Betaproteobacteria bacterium]|nr:phospholipase D family protein [Betaproteobacteria bacterium]
MASLPARARSRQGCRRYSLLALLLIALPAHAAEPLTLTLQGAAQVAFTPGDDAGALVITAIRNAKKQVLVQAYSFTHRDIGQALIDAKRRGVDVRVIVDLTQTENGKTSLIGWLTEQGVPMWVDAEHPAAHNKVMVIDAGAKTAAVVTGSFNFSHAADFRNAENVLVLRDNPNLAEAYAANWRRHFTHARPVRPGMFPVLNPSPRP